MTKKQLQARVAELELMVQTLTIAINAMRNPLYVSPSPTQPIVNPLPYTPFPMPYIGDPPYYPWGPTTGTGNIQSTPMPGVICINGTNDLLGGAVQGDSQCRSLNS